MKKAQAYVEKLRGIENWDEYLMQESGLPGPRGNLELIQAVAEIGNEEQFLHLICFTPEKAPVNSQEEFLAACGTVGLGRLVAEGKTEYLRLLRSFASDPRWRTREGVAMALQIYGEEHMDEFGFRSNRQHICCEIIKCWLFSDDLCPFQEIE